MTYLQSAPKQQLWNVELANFANFAKLEKFELPDKKEDLNSWKKAEKKDSCSPANPHL